MGIIGGTGAERLCRARRRRVEVVRTRFGYVEIVRAILGEVPVVFLSRHGEQHTVLPHRINHRAHALALAASGAQHILAINAVGSLRADLAPGSLLAPDDFIDRMRAAVTLCEEPSGAGGLGAHRDFTAPYCARCRSALICGAEIVACPIRARGTYLCTDGPRYESAAEVREFAAAGGDVVGMTGVPEAIVAREAGLCYAALTVVTNLGAGLTAGPISGHSIASTMSAASAAAMRVVEAAAQLLAAGAPCGCARGES